jgi:hypothetical protein
VNIRNAVPASALSAAGLLFGAAIIPAGTAFAVTSVCGTGATLVDDGICEVTFTETPDSAWTPPAGISKLQVLLVGAGAGSGDPGGNEGYAGGGGDVQLVELSTSGAVDITVGIAQEFLLENDDSDSSVSQGSVVHTAAGGESPYTLLGLPWGGNSGNGNSSEESFGGGGGAGGDAGVGYENAWSGGPGLVVNEIDPGTFDLFANNDECLGAGGTYSNFWIEDSSIAGAVRSYDCGRNLIPDGYTWIEDNSTLWFDGQGTDLEDFWIAEPTPNSGTGGSTGYFPNWNGGATQYQLGADGKVVLRYDAVLAETGFDVTGSLVAGAALVAAGAMAVTRRRQVTV